STAVAFIAAGMAVAWRDHASLRWVARVQGALVLTIATTIGLQYSGVHIGARLAEWSPGVRAAISWFILLLYGLALLLPAGRGVASEQRVELLVALIMMGSLSSTIARGYLHQAPPAGALGLVPVLGFLALSLALLF